ncbi:MAG: cupin domain-containing protein [Proteobacteria bacterium]|nr:cupin domain-containing protein [Pseudomonadota bacterium]
MRLVAKAGATREFSAGAAFVIPAGFAGTWETIEAAEKHYVVLEPA